MVVQVNPDSIAKVKEWEKQYWDFKKAEYEEEYRKKKAENEMAANALKADDIRQNNTTKNPRTGEEITFWQHSLQQADEALKQDLASYNNGAQAVAALAAMLKIMTDAMHHSLRGLTYYKIKHFFMKETTELREITVGDAVNVNYSIGIKDGKLNIPAIEFDSSKNPQAGELVNAMHSTFSDVIKCWLTEQHQCIATADPNVFLDPVTGNVLTEEQFNGFVNHNTKGLQSYLDALSPPNLHFVAKAEVAEEPEPERSRLSP